MSFIQYIHKKFCGFTLIFKKISFNNNVYEKPFIKFLRFVSIFIEKIKTKIKNLSFPYHK